MRKVQYKRDSLLPENSKLFAHELKGNKKAALYM